MQCMYVCVFKQNSPPKFGAQGSKNAGDVLFSSVDITVCLI